MTAQRISFGGLQRLLIKHRFRRSRQADPYVVFTHERSGALQAFRQHEFTESADPMTLASVRKTLVGFGFLKAEEFESAIDEAEREIRKKTGRK